MSRKPKAASLSDKETTLNLVDDYLSQADWRVRENANSQFSVQGLNAYLAGTISANYWLDRVYPQQIAEAHQQGFIHIHDIGAGLLAYCTGWDLQVLLQDGYGGVPGQVTCSPPRHLSSALGQLVSFLFSVQQDCAGAVAVSNLDTLLAPYVHKEGLDYREVKQAMQEFIYQINMPGRTGMQRPFTNVTLDFTIPAHMQDMPVLLGGDTYGVYGDFAKEAAMIARAFFEVMHEGDALGQSFPFPIPTVNITPDFDWESEAAKALLRATAKFGTPYFANFIRSDMKPEDVRSFCCRLTLDLRELKKRGGGLFGAAPQTGCYDDKTRVLTGAGWKYFKDVTLEDEICTLNPETGQIEYHKPIRTFEYDYDGNLIQFTHYRMKSPLVTPNHNMYVKRRDEHFFLQAQEDFSDCRYRLPKTGVWHGKDMSIITIDGVEATHERAVGNTEQPDYTTVKKTYPPLTFNTEDFCRFLGVYIGDGCTRVKSHGGYEIVLTHGGNKRKRKYYSDVLNRLGVKWHEEGCSFGFFSIQLYHYLEEKVGHGCKCKRIPREVLELDKRYLECLWDGLLQSDGSVNRLTGQVTYYTTSKGLADDVAELIYKLGYSTTIRLRQERGEATFPDGHRTITGPCYELTLIRTKHHKYSRFRKEHVPYKGKVYCLEVPNHIMLVERDGYIMWCGNSLGVVTLNLPRLAYLSDSKEGFFSRIDEMIDLAAESLMIKREYVERYTDLGLHPFARRYLQPVKSAHGQYWANHFNTIGLVGMAEACLNLLGTGIETEEGWQLARDVLLFMREKLLRKQRETGLMFNLEATPAEGCSYRLARLDRAEFPDIITAGTDSAPYYTNSTMLPVDYTSNLFEALNHQSPLLKLYTGGSVFHIFLGEKQPDPDACAVLIRKIFMNYELPYMSLTPTYSICQDHGYIFGRHESCPQCGAECEVYSRIVGYYRPTSAYNDGKRIEFNDRATFDSAFAVL